MFNYDIYRLLRNETDLKTRLVSLSQSSIERFLGIRNVRRDTISGRESISLYNKYALDGNKLNEALILTHNREDVQQLHTIVPAIHKDSFLPNWKTNSLDKALANYGFPLNGRFSIRTAINKSKCQLRIVGTQFSMPFDAEIFPDGELSFRANFNKKNCSYEIIIPLKSYGDNLFLNSKALGISEKLQGLDNYVNGYYIISENGKENFNAINRLSQELLIHLVDVLEPFSNSPY